MMSSTIDTSIRSGPSETDFPGIEDFCSYHGIPVSDEARGKLASITPFHHAHLVTCLEAVLTDRPFIRRKTSDGIEMIRIVPDGEVTMGPGYPDWSGRLYTAKLVPRMAQGHIAGFVYPDGTSISIDNYSVTDLGNRPVISMVMPRVELDTGVTIWGVKARYIGTQSGSFPISQVVLNLGYLSGVWNDRGVMDYLRIDTGSRNRKAVFSSNSLKRQLVPISFSNGGSGQSVIVPETIHGTELSLRLDPPQQGRNMTQRITLIEADPNGIAGSKMFHFELSIPYGLSIPSLLRAVPFADIRAPTEEEIRDLDTSARLLRDRNIPLTPVYSV